MADFECIDNSVLSMASMSASHASFAHVIFRDVLETFPVETSLVCKFTIQPSLCQQKCDRVGLYKVGWTSVDDHICFVTVSVSDNYVTGMAAENCVQLDGQVLPHEDGEFYQFCYVTGSGQVCGASPPFQFGTDDFEIIDDNDTDAFLVGLDSDSKLAIKNNTDVNRGGTTDTKDIQCETNTVQSAAVAADRSTDVPTDGELSSVELNELRRAYSTAVTDLDITRRESVNLAGEIEEMAETHRREKKELQNGIEELQGKLVDKIDTCCQLEREMEILKSRLSEYEPKFSELEGSLYALQTVQSSMAERNARLARELEEFTKQNRDLKKSLDDALKREIELKEARATNDVVNSSPRTLSYLPTAANCEISLDGETDQPTENVAHLEVVLAQQDLEGGHEMKYSRKGDESVEPQQSMGVVNEGPSMESLFYPFKTFFCNPYADYIPEIYRSQPASNTTV